MLLERCVSHRSLACGTMSAVRWCCRTQSLTPADAAAIAEETFWRSGCETMMGLLAALLEKSTDELPLDLRRTLFAGVARCVGDVDDRWHTASLQSAASGT